MPSGLKKMSGGPGSSDLGRPRTNRGGRLGSRSAASGPLMESAGASSALIGEGSSSGVSRVKNLSLL